MSLLQLKHQDPVFVAEAAKQAVDPETWERLFREALYGSNTGAAEFTPSPLHRSVVSHFRQRSQNVYLATLNFDTLLEKAMDKNLGSVIQHQSLPSRPTVEFRPELGSTGHLQESCIPVYHLHGFATPENSQDIILTLNDVSDLTNDPNPWQLSFLRSAIDEGPVVIAGASFRDPDVRQWMRRLRQERGDLNGSTIVIARESFSLSSEEFQRFHIPLRNQWEAVGMKVQIVEDHADAAQIFQELPFLPKDGYRSPQRRTGALWRHHRQNFSMFQAQDASNIREDAAVLSETLAVRHLNLTVWLANGARQLVRWAVDDRVQTDLDKLKTVLSGHDSRYYAGKVLGQDTPMIKSLPQGTESRWHHVCAIPIAIEGPDTTSWPVAVLTAGLPEETQLTDDNRLVLEDTLKSISNDWTYRLKDRFVVARELD